MPLQADGRPDLPAITRALEEDPDIRMVHIQRSRGYHLRPSLSVAEIGRIVGAVRAQKPDAVVFVDNCYGEFVEREEPTAVGPT